MEDVWSSIIDHQLKNIPMKKKNIFSYLHQLLGRKKKSKPGVKLSKEYIEVIRFRMNDLMDKKRPYLQKQYHIKDMADELEVPVHQLSAFLNQVLGMRFNDYMNKHRVSYCEQLILADATRTHNLTELVDQCGFNNKNSFTAAFKKFTGRKPFEYIKLKHAEAKMN